MRAQAGEPYAIQEGDEWFPKRCLRLLAIWPFLSRIYSTIRKGRKLLFSKHVIVIPEKGLKEGSGGHLAFDFGDFFDLSGEPVQQIRIIALHPGIQHFF